MRAVTSREIGTADCVEALVKAKGGSPADWKRRSKVKRGQDVVRNFRIPRNCPLCS